MITRYSLCLGIDEQHMYIYTERSHSDILMTVGGGGGGGGVVEVTEVHIFCQKKSQH